MKKMIKKVEYIILAIGFFVAACIYAEEYVSSIWMSAVISLYAIISMMIIFSVSIVFRSALDNVIEKKGRISNEALADVLQYHNEIVGKIGYILFVGGAGVIYLLQLII